MHRNSLMTMFSPAVALFGLHASLRTVEEEDAAAVIVAMELAALDRWGKGDPDGFLEIVDAGVTYFDPFQERRIDGSEGLKQLYAQLRGKIHIDQYEMLNPKVQVTGDVGVLTFNFKSAGSEGTTQWNCTEVYRRRRQGWRIIHTHWSWVKPSLTAGPAPAPTVA